MKAFVRLNAINEGLVDLPFFSVPSSRLPVPCKARVS
jgi:hypothetical protein